MTRTWPANLATDEGVLAWEFLDFLRETAVLKADGLTRDQAAAAPVVTSPKLTALGVLKHLVAVERYWLCIAGAGLDLPSLWKGDPDPSWDLVDDDTPESLIQAYRQEWDNAEALKQRGPDDSAADEKFTVRWILAHVTQETARHVGHLDLLRELADGQTGE
ncbi:DinB family protein [Lentzea sp. BCCO 10_0856]|uniref:DinB family protein n=1 Tax=Lentzea miocenica TaxID=3095431 RepID=A0ABU4TCM8_9PSEU|nr:DinB family protein [Lentzea sp. BCCO 10_0856]MDX8035921.1 DinB family protein [Lentzea sp. BCCO 10_0856]